MSRRERRKIGRNDPCPCGSGKKYKNCCGRTASKTDTSRLASLSDKDMVLMRRTIERDLLALKQLVEGREFESEKELEAFLREATSGGKLPEWSPKSPAERAQELIYKAWEPREKKERIQLAMQALKIWPDCADAYVILAEEAAETLEQARDWYEKGMKAAEKTLGPKVFEEEAGNFWILVETRPYMRAREGLADCLHLLGDCEAAIEHYRGMLRLNPNDNQGIRYRLLRCLLETRDLDGAEEFLSRFGDDDAAAWLFSRALLTFTREGNSQKARRQLARAIKANPHVPAYLLGEKQIPETLPHLASLGDENEAVDYAFDHRQIWVATRGALDWLAELSNKLKA